VLAALTLDQLLSVELDTATTAKIQAVATSCRAS
jgi:hypothetical protein